MIKPKEKLKFEMKTITNKKVKKKNIFRNKQGFLLRDIVIAGLFAIGVIGLLVIAIASMASNYDKPDLITPGFSNNYDKLNGLLNQTQITWNATTSSSGLNFIGTFNIAFNSIFTVFRLVLSTIDLYGSMAASIVSDYTFLDTTVVKILLGVLISALMIVTIFIWISSVTRGRI